MRILPTYIVHSMSINPDPESGEPKPSTENPHRRWLPTFDDSPPFHVWLRRSWLDIVTQLLCVLVAFLIYRFSKPLMPRYFPLYEGIERSAWGIKYGKPYVEEYVTTFVSAVVSFAAPAVAIGAVGLWKIRNFWDTNAAMMGLGYALSTATLFQSFIKWMIGGLRPHFLSVCKPESMSPRGIGSETLGFDRLFTTAAEVCTGPEDKIKEAQMSFPSGHSCAAFAGFGFLALYINAKYQVFTRRENGRRVRHWKLVIFAVPWLVAVLIAASKVRDMWHHTTDVLAGAIVGTLFAHLAFRMVYRSIYDWKENHVAME